MLAIISFRFLHVSVNVCTFPQQWLRAVYNSCGGLGMSCNFGCGEDGVMCIKRVGDHEIFCGF
jgi:hypothetical protein